MNAVDYFEAVQEGRRRVNDAINLLQPIAGPCYPMLFLKIGIADWTPVGKEMLHAVVPGKGDTAALVICDSDGNTKTMSAWVPAAKAEEFSGALAAKGIPKFEGEVKLPI
jgi:hypothetical protein